MAAKPGVRDGESTREAVLEALRRATGPIDGYGIAKAARVSPLQAGRALEKLAADGLAVKEDELDGLSDPSASFRPVA